MPYKKKAIQVKWVCVQCTTVVFLFHSFFSSTVIKVVIKVYAFRRFIFGSFLDRFWVVFGSFLPIFYFRVQIWYSGNNLIVLKIEYCKHVVLYIMPSLTLTKNIDNKLSKNYLKSVYTCSNDRFIFFMIKLLQRLIKANLNL